MVVGKTKLTSYWHSIFPFKVHQNETQVTWTDKKKYH